MEEKRYPIGEVAFLLNRKPHTLRVWAYQNRLPEELLPHRDNNNRRYWTGEQIEGLTKWMEDVDLRPGKALRPRKVNSDI